MFRLRLLWALGAPLLLACAAPARAQEPKPPQTSLATEICASAGLQGRVLWMDGSANLERLSSFSGVDLAFDRAQRAGFNTVVVDAKPLSGHALYPSRIAPRLTQWKGFRYPEQHDLVLQTMLAARRRKLKYFVSINVFSDAHKLLKSGPLYERPEWQSIVYDVQRSVQTAAGEEHAIQVGLNVGPAANAIAAYDATADPRVLREDEVLAVIEQGVVSGLVDGALTPGGSVRASTGSHLLIGRGRAGAWLLGRLRVGDQVHYRGEPVLQPILEAPSELVGGFMNPAIPEVRRYALSVIGELSDRYAIDGLVLDRMRYSSIRSDFSPLSRTLFEKAIGKTVERWPEDVFEYDPTPGGEIRRGPHFTAWIEWRAEVIRSFVAEARELVNRVRPGMQLAVYVGSWYDQYYDVGVNWGAPGFHPGYDWMSAGYDRTGYAPLLDWITTGCYYPAATREDARMRGEPEERSVEAAAQLSVRAVDDVSFVYAGLYLLDYKDRPELFSAAVNAALQNSQGVMIFDLVYLEDYGWWNLLEETLGPVQPAPHEAPGLVNGLRRVRAALRGAGRPGLLETGSTAAPSSR